MPVNKYLRPVRDARPGFGGCVSADVYAVLEAFRVTCPARQHAIKKLLCAGQRGKNDTLSDLREAVSAVERAIELETWRIHDEEEGQRGVPAGGAVLDADAGEAGGREP